LLNHLAPGRVAAVVHVAEEDRVSIAGGQRELAQAGKAQS
jgi:hypothetical protein